MSCSSPKEKTHVPPKTVVVTGAGQRIGLCLAKTFLRQGFAVIALVRKDSQELLEFQKSYPKHLTILQKDLQTHVWDKSFWAMLAKTHGPLYAFIHSASTFIDDSPHSTTPALYSCQQRINKDVFVEAAYSYYQFVAQNSHDKAPGAASFIALLDQKVERLNPSHFSYTLSKLQLAASIPYLAQALSPYVRVNAVSPGLTLPSGGQSSLEFAAKQSSFPFGFGPKPQDIAATVAFIMASSCLVGQTLTVDAGQHLVADEDIVCQKDKYPIQLY